VSLVENEVVPRFPPEDVLIGEDELVRRDADVESVLGVPSSTFLLPISLVSVVGHDFEAGEELSRRRGRRERSVLGERKEEKVASRKSDAHLLELHLPVEDDGSRNDDEMRSPHSLLASEVREKRDCLDRLPENGKRKQTLQVSSRLLLSSLSERNSGTHPRPISSAKIPFVSLL